MNEMAVRIVRLSSMRVASAQAFGAAPEMDAWGKLSKWAEAQGLLGDRPRPRVFGFNNPDPSPGSPNYGYEFWMVAGSEASATGGIQLKEFKGGTYGVIRCEVRGDPETAIPAAWQKLLLWRETSQYRMGSHQWLEEHLTGPDVLKNEWDMDLYLPIQE